MPRSVVVTGGTSGIGAAVARRFADAGASVTVIGRDPDRVSDTARSLGARGIASDTPVPADLERAAAVLEGGIDVLVAMAGGIPSSDGAAHLSALERADAEWTRVLRANTVSTALTVEAFLPVMRAGGSIITVSSIGAEYASGPYGASKAAVAARMAGLSAQVAPRGITANAVAPGYIEATAFFGETMTVERRQRLIDATHDGRPGTPDDVAGLALFLASADARHITGQTLHVNGGAHTTR